MKITTLGIIAAIKNLGLFVSISWQFDAIAADPLKFIYATIIYMLVSFASDLYLLNKAHEPEAKVT